MGLLAMNDAARSAGRPDGDDAAARPSTRSAGQRASFAMFVGLTFAITWLLWIPGVVVFGDQLSAASPFQVPGFVVLQTLGAAGPSIAAWIVLRRSEGRQAIRRIGDRYRRWRVGLRWYVVAVLLVPVLQVAVLAGDAMIGADAVVPAASPLGQMLGDLGVAGLVAVFPVIVASNVFSSPLLEEFGWRGFALPRLQRRYSALTSSVLLGVVWGVWHTPLTVAYGDPLGPLVLEIVAVTILMTWVFNHTAGSMILMLLFHASLNASVGPLSGDATPWAAALLTAAVAALVVVRCGADNLSARQRFHAT